MATVQLDLGYHRYEIVIQPGSLTHLGKWVAAVAAHDRCTLFSDAAVSESYAVDAQSSLEAAGYRVAAQVIPSGEKHKNLDTVRGLYNVLLDHRMERASPVIALGGGVVGDTAGFVAATYLRGVPFIQCPTTLLAMVDASVGGKVGVNVPQGKNLVGSFHQPMVVVIDPDTLATLPERELRCGLAECVKHAVIRDAELFDWIERNVDAILALDRPVLTELIQRNVQIKSDVVRADEKEAGVRAHLNFGHTFAHAIEATTGFGQDATDGQSPSTRGGYHHGEAVSLGMVAAARLAVDLGRCERDVPDRLIQLLNRIGLPTTALDLPPDRDLLQAMRLDKKVRDSKLRLILPDRVGRVSVFDDVSDDRIMLAWGAVRST